MLKITDLKFKAFKVAKEERLENGDVFIRGIKFVFHHGKMTQIVEDYSTDIDGECVKISRRHSTK